MNIVDAKFDDIEILAIHHRKMFEEIWKQKGICLETDMAKKVESAYMEKLCKQIPQGICKAWVIKNNDQQIIASGAITIISLVPVPMDLNYNIAYLHSIFTDKQYRHKQCAQNIVDRAIQYCQDIGINRIILNASESGKPLYVKKGFLSSPEAMKLFINK